MKFIYTLLFAILTVFNTSFLMAQEVDIGQETSFSRELRTNDVRPIREFVESKENISLKDKDQNLEMSGDVRFEYQNLHEKSLVIKVNEHKKKFYQKYEAVRGNPNFRLLGLPLSNNDFDVEFNFKLKYTYDKAWFAAHVQYDNPAGCKGFDLCKVTLADENLTIERSTRDSFKGSGFADGINLKRAYMGYTLYADGRHRWNLEIGRRKLNDIFESEIQFSNRFDGVLIEYTAAIDKVESWYWTAGVFVVDERVNRFGSAFEVGLLNVADFNFDLKYSLINWLGNNRTRCVDGRPFGYNYLNSQVTLNYYFDLPLCLLYAEHNKHQKSCEFYTAFLINHAAKKCRSSHFKKKNLGWYAGVMIGEVEEKGDWSLDIEYLVVQAQAVNDFDVDGICRGNIQNDNFFDVWTLKDDGVVVDVLVPGRGNANYKGWKFEFLYAVTDNFSLDILYQFSHPEDSHIGGPHHYTDFKAEAIYAF